MRVAIISPYGVPELGSGWHEVGGHQVLVISGEGRPLWPGNASYMDDEPLFEEFVDLYQRGRLDQIIVFMDADKSPRVFEALAFADGVSLKILYCDCKFNRLQDQLVDHGIFGETWQTSCNGGRPELRSLIRALGRIDETVAA